MAKQSDDRRAIAMAEFRRMMVWIVIIAIIMTIGALIYISQDEPLKLHIAIATIGGVFFSVVLGSGLFAAAFFSDKSGHDDAATIKRPEPPTTTPDV